MNEMIVSSMRDHQDREILTNQELELVVDLSASDTDSDDSCSHVSVHVTQETDTSNDQDIDLTDKGSINFIDNNNFLSH